MPQAAVAASLFGPRFPTIQRYVDMLLGTGIAWGLIGPREADRIWERHILNSASLTALVPPDASLVDVGSGAGLPGIPVAVLRPDVTVSLLEPLDRRIRFLTQTVDDLGITDQVRVVRSCAEDHREQYEIVASRALAPLPTLLRWCQPLLTPGGSILALKGRTAADEVARAARELTRADLRAEVLTIAAHPSAEPAIVVRVTAA